MQMRVCLSVCCLFLRLFMRACVHACVRMQSMAFLLSGNMDKGSTEFQLEAAISKIFSSVSACCGVVMAAADLCTAGGRVGSGG